MATTTTTTTTTQSTSTSTRTGTQLNVGTSQTSYNLGNYVTDVSLLPYMDEVVIGFIAVGMRPNTRLHVFFDGMLMDAHSAPGTIDGSKPSTDYNHVKPSAPYGTAITTDSQGVAIGRVYVPDGTVRVGERTLELMDVDNINLGVDAATTAATATYVSQTLSLTRQTITLTTVNPVLNYTPLSQTKVSTAITKNVVSSTVPDAPQPQTVTVKVTVPPAPKAPAPAPNIPTPSAPVYVPPPAPIQPPPAVPTIAVPAPAAPPQILPNAWSAIVDNPWAGIPQSLLIDPVAQSFTVAVAPSVAGCFLTSIDLYFRQKARDAQHGVTVYVCENTTGMPDSKKILPYSQIHLPFSSINTSNDGTVATRFTFPSPVYVTNGDQYSFVVRPDASDPDYALWTARLGDRDVKNGQQMFSMPVSGTLFTSQNQSAWSPVQDEYIKFNIRRADFDTSSGLANFVNLNYEFFLLTGVTYPNISSAIIAGDMVYSSTNSTPSTCNTNIHAVVENFQDDANLFRLRCKDSTAGFSEGGTIQVHRINGSLTPNANTLVAFATVNQLYYTRANSLAPQFSEIAPAGTSITAWFTSTSNSYVADSKALSTPNGTTIELYDYERIIASRSKEVSRMSSNKSLKTSLYLNTTSCYLSPVVDTVGASFLAVANLITPFIDLYGEQYNTGTAFTKYISPPVTLSAGQDSEDLQVLITAHRPAVSEITVMAKFLSAHDPGSIHDKTWSLLYNTGQKSYTTNDPNDQLEYTFKVPPAIPSAPMRGKVSCSGNTVTGTGTGFLHGTEGYYIKVGTDTRQIASVTNSSVMTVTSNFSQSWSANTIYSQYLPTHAFVSAADLNQLTGTVSATSGTNIMTGSGTDFVNELATGTAVIVGNDSLRVSSVSNSTYATMQQPFNDDHSSANGFTETTNGVTYSDDSGAQYNTYITFQIKVIITSSDTSKVPTLDDIRGIALLT